MSQGPPSCLQNSADAPANKDEATSPSEASLKESTDLQRVLKEVGITSATFIGPAFPPRKNIDDSLSDFYKEIRAIDDGAEKERKALVRAQTSSSTSGLPENPSSAGNLSKSSENPCTEENLSKAFREPPEEEDACRAPGRLPPWPHWYKNQPYSSHRPDRRFSRNRPDYYPPAAFPPPPPHPGWFSRFGQPSSPNPQCFPPPRHEQYSSGFPGPGYNHHDFGGHDDDGAAWWPCDAPPGHSEKRQYFERSSYLVLILMRGLPGSGKTTMARELLATGPSGLILSTDDYFAHGDGYRYRPGLLGDAHKWNHRRASEAMHAGRSPIIIDNTNLQAWEMKPYVQMALQRGYRVDFCEPNTSWKYDPYELEKRNKHGVPQEKIAQMLDRFFYPVSVDAVLSSQEPPHVQHRRQTEPGKDAASFR